MELWLILLTTLCVSLLLNHLLFSKSPKLPPGPFSLPFLGNPLWLRRSPIGIESLLRALHSKHGPIVTLRFATSKPTVFIASRSLAHRALVHHGAIFSDRPAPPPAAAVLNSRGHIISSASYGPTWRLLRRNLTSHILNPTHSLSASFSPLRRRVLRLLLDNLNSQSQSKSSSETPVVLLVHFRYAMFCLLVFMCFGDDGSIDAGKIEEIESVQVRMLQTTARFMVLNMWPRLGKVLFRKRWNEFHEMVNWRSSVLAPVIRARIIRAEQKKTQDHDSDPMCYVDTLKNLELPEEGKRKLTEGEMVSLCSEFLTAGTDTTTTALQWIMANLVKHPHIQERLYSEIRGVLMSDSSKQEEKTELVEEEDLQKMPYLKAVVLEGLRRHPPGRFVLPHSVMEDVELGGYVIPKKATVNFMVAEMGRDPEAWEDPMAFKPERFMMEGGGGVKDEVDITGSKEIKMMPFGVGRRICPAVALAMLHLEYFVANLVWRFEWKGLEGEDVDLSEKPEFTVVMKNPLRAKLSPRGV